MPGKKQEISSVEELNSSDSSVVDQNVQPNFIDQSKKITSFDVSKFCENKFTKNNALSLEGSSNGVCNYFFELNPETKVLSLSKGSSVETESRDVFELKELLSWPGVGVKIELPCIAIQRHCESNVQWDLVEHEQSQIPLVHLKPNKDAVYRYYASKADKSLASLENEVELSHDNVITYLEGMIKCLSVTNYAKRYEIEQVLRAILDDMQKISRSFVNLQYSYHLNDHKYYRTFSHDVELSSNVQLFSLREIYNPEIIFKISRCSFEELSKIDFEQINNFFKAILVEKDPDAIEEFNTMLGNGYSLYCVECQKRKSKVGQYKCAKRVAYMSQHIGPYCVNEFDCVKCKFHSNVVNLAKEGWHHFCEESTNEDE